MLNKTEQQIKNIILDNLDSQDEYELFIFGSRANGESRKYSDYDIGIKGKKELSLEVLTKIKNVFDDSDLPFKVDVVDFFQVSDSFKTEALKNIKKL